MLIMYYSPKHIFLCLVDDRYVALDLKSDRYISFKGQRADVLGLLTASQPSDGVPDIKTAKIPKEIVEETASQLAKNGLLTRDPRCGKPFTLTKFDLPRDQLVRDTAAERTRVHIGHVWAFFAACITASKQLRRRPIEEIVNRIRERKAQHISPGYVPDNKKVRNLVIIFNKLRPLFPRNYLCTFDSIALIEFLARYKIFPTWVFGVDVDPFKAHCWVQESGIVYNDHVDLVKTHTPIMTV